MFTLGLLLAAADTFKAPTNSQPVEQCADASDCNNGQEKNLLVPGAVLAAVGTIALVSPYGRFRSDDSVSD
jgi:hypothetical protein